MLSKMERRKKSFLGTNRRLEKCSMKYITGENGAKRNQRT